MKTMINFDSLTLVPGYSDIESRSQVDTTTTLKNIKSKIPIINANMLSICTPQMIHCLEQNNTISSYHRFFENESAKRDFLLDVNPRNLDFLFKTQSKTIHPLYSAKKKFINKDLFFMSVGTKKEEYEFIDYLHENNYKNIIIDVNHGHHVNVRKICEYVKSKYSDMFVMAGNVSSTDGIKYLLDSGADCIKIGNSFGFSCTTIKQTGFGVHPLHTAKCYREETNDWESLLCLDGGIRDVADIAKCLIWGNVVMIGKMLAGTDESAGKVVNGLKEYYGNASIVTKQLISNDENHVKHIEGTIKYVPIIGSMQSLLNSITEGLQSAFSFVGARNLEDYQMKAQSKILYL